ncbi:MAG: hypothetical protein IIY55_05520, partial [Blautia sp.]|nr:hypothetical protein [Blautia sp.]
MKNPLKFFLIYLLSFIMTVVISAGLLFAAALIPRDAVQKNMQESAEYYVEKAADSNIIPGIKATFVDRFADSLILNITYHLDPEHPLESVMWSYFYGYPSQHAPQYLLDSINGAYGENPRMEEYLRYWHGSVVFMKIFHLFWNIKHITVFHCALLLTLTLILLFMLWRRKYTAEIIGLLISLIAVSAWVAPLGLEFYWVFPIMMITAIISLIMIEKNCSERSFILLFLVVGMITVYLDFLTTETITILVPLLLITRIRARKEEHASFIAQFLFSLKCSISWLIGYLGMWAAKWLLAKMILHIEV